MFFLMPMMNLTSVKEGVMGVVRKVWARGRSEIRRGVCPICGEMAKMAHTDDNPEGCQHYFCYYCIKEKMIEQNGYLCQEDDIKILGLRRVV